MEFSKDIINQLNETMKAFPGRKYIFTIPEKFENHCKDYFLSVAQKLKQTLLRKTLFGFFEVFVVLISLTLMIYSFTFISIIQKVFPADEGIIGILLFVLYIIAFIFFEDLFTWLKRLYLKGYLSDESIKFCYLQIATDNLKHYINNEVPSHLKKAYKNLDLYLNNENIQITIKYKNKSYTQPVYAITNEISKSVSWFKLDDDSELINNAFQKTEKTFLPLIANGKNIENVLKVLLYLKGYAYSKIDKSISKEEVTILGNNQTISIKKYGELLLLGFGEEMKLIEEYSVETKKFRFNSIRAIYRKIYSLLQHPDIIVCFISWVVFLGMILGPISYSCLQMMTNDITAGAVATIIGSIFGASVAFTVLVHKSK